MIETETKKAPLYPTYDLMKASVLAGKQGWVEVDLRGLGNIYDKGLSLIQALEKKNVRAAITSGGVTISIFDNLHPATSPDDSENKRRYEAAINILKTYNYPLLFSYEFKVQGKIIGAKDNE